MKHASHYKPTRSLAPLVGAVSLALTATSGMAETNDPKYTMTVYEDYAHGASIVAGDYEQAIEKITTKRVKNDPVRVETNLCVAYVKAGEVELAEKSCDAAVAAVESTKQFDRRAIGIDTNAGARRRYLAIALSNRCVMKAVKGDLASAKEDFDMAMELDTRLAAAKVNLERLEIAVENAA